MKKLLMLIVALTMIGAVAAEKIQTLAKADAQASQTYYGKLAGPDTALVGMTCTYTATIPGAVSYSWEGDADGKHSTLSPSGNTCQVTFIRSSYTEVFCYGYDANGRTIGYQWIDVIVR